MVGLAMMGMAGSANATLIVDGGTGQLLGATDVLVDGILFGVEFVDGTCFDLFDGCDDAADFDFADDAAALLAAMALLDQVLIDGGPGQFDSQPQDIEGCGPGVGSCFILIPRGTGGFMGIFLRGAIATNSAVEVEDGTGLLLSLPLTLDTATSGSLVFAVFTPPAVVPEPSTLLLFGVGLAGLAAIRRRRRKPQRD